jgi:hypothetical protein
MRLDLFQQLNFMQGDPQGGVRFLVWPKN